MSLKTTLINKIKKMCTKNKTSYNITKVAKLPLYNLYKLTAQNVA